MSDPNDDANGNRTMKVGGATAAQRTQPTFAGPSVGKVTRVEAEMGGRRTGPATAPGKAVAPRPAGHVEPMAPPASATALALGPANEAARDRTPQAPMPSGATAGQLAAAHQDVSQLAPAGQSAQPATPAAAQSSFSKMAFQAEVELGPLKLTAIAKRKDGDAAVFSAKGPTMEVGSAPIDHPARIDTKVKASELKVGLSKKGLSLQETVLSAEGSLTLFEGMKVRVKLGAFEAKIPIDYSLLKLTVEGEASDVHWFDALLGEAASLVRVEVRVSGSIALDKALLTKLIAELAPFAAAALKFQELDAEVAAVTQKIAAAKKARDAARAEQALAKQAEHAAAKRGREAAAAEARAVSAEARAVSAEARAVATEARTAARAANVVARTEAETAHLARTAASKLARSEANIFAKNQRVLKALAPRLKAAATAMKTAERGIKGLLAKKIGARIGKVLATRAGQTLLKALPVIGWVLIAKDLFDIGSWLIHLPWEGGGFFGEDGAGAGDGGTPAANPGPMDAAPPAPAGGVDADGGDADRGVDGAGTTGVDQTGGATPTTAAPAPATKSTAPAARPTTPPAIPVPTPAATAVPAPARQQATAPTPSGHGDHATQAAEQGKHGNGGSGSGSGSGVGNGSTATAPEPQQPTTVSATGSSAPTGDTAMGKTPDVTPKSADGSHSDGESVDHDAQDSADHDAKDAADHDIAADGKNVATSASQQPPSVPTPAQAKELKRKAKAKAERKAKAAAEAAERKKAANETADRRLFWGGDQEILAALHWDGTTLTKDARVLNACITQMQQHPKVASNGATVALRRMQVTIGKAIGTQIPVEVRYLAEQQRGAQWLPCAQDVQSLLFDIPSKQLRVAGIGMHAVLFDGGVLQVKNGQVVKARETFTMAGIGTFQIEDLNRLPSDDDHYVVKVRLKLLNILDRKATFQVDGGKWHELGSAEVKRDGITTTLKHQKSAN